MRWYTYGDPLGSKPREKLLRLCSIEGCGKKHCALGYCRMHWKRQHENNVPMNAPPRFQQFPKNEDERKEHRRVRALAAAKAHRQVSMQDVIDAYGTVCYICKEDIDLTAPRTPIQNLPGWERGFQIEHVVPLSKGGANTIENTRPSHALCNVIKGVKDGTKR